MATLPPSYHQLSKPVFPPTYFNSERSLRLGYSRGTSIVTAVAKDETANILYRISRNS